MFGGSVGIGPIGPVRTGSVVLLNSQQIDKGFTRTRDQIFRGVFKIVIAGKFRGSQSTLRFRGRGYRTSLDDKIAWDTVVS